MRVRWALTLLLAGGCRQLFGIDDTTVDQDGAGSSDATIADSAAPPIDGAPDANPLTGCPMSYSIITPSGARYRRVPQDLDWLDAVMVCAKDAPSSMAVFTHLAVFATDADRAEVHLLSPTTTWLGLSERRTPGVWIWVTQEPAGGYPTADDPAWTMGEPDGDGQCGAIDENGGYEDRACDGTADVPFLCECDVYPDDPSRY